MDSDSEEIEWDDNPANNSQTLAAVVDEAGDINEYHEDETPARKGEDDDGHSDRLGAQYGLRGPIIVGGKELYLRDTRDDLPILVDADDNEIWTDDNREIYVDVQQDGTVILLDEDGNNVMY